jgi:hypothetical protein
VRYIVIKAEDGCELPELQSGIELDSIGGEPHGYRFRAPCRVGNERYVATVLSHPDGAPGATTASGFGVINQVTQPVFGARLGFIGVDFGAFGRIAFGKQNSTHYDITDYTTDRFNVFGGQSTATYVAGTDGGQSGTGRADQIILYHLKFAKIFDFGAQGQLRTGATSQAFNGFGFSLQATVLPGLTIGGAYNKTYFNPRFSTPTPGACGFGFLLRDRS